MCVDGIPRAPHIIFIYVLPSRTKGAGAVCVRERVSECDALNNVIGVMKNYRDWGSIPAPPSLSLSFLAPSSFILGAPPPRPPGPAIRSQGPSVTI